jgi:predicted metalloprotease with PDZ domain
MRCCRSFLLLLCTLPLLSASQSLRYTITPANEKQSLLIRLEFNGNPAGYTKLAIPYDSGQWRPQDHFRIIGVNGARHHGRVAGDSASYSIDHKPGAVLRIDYVISNALADTIPSLHEIYAQMLTPRFFYMTGDHLLITPQDSTLYSVQLHWKGFPQSWNFLSTHTEGRKPVTFRARMAAVREAIYMGGDIRIHKLIIQSKPVYFATRGTWSFPDSAVFGVISRTMIAQRQYWNDYATDRYTISLIPMKYVSEGERSINGRALYQTFVTVGTNSKALGLEDLLFLYNHELMHHWFGNILPQAAPEARYKWFHEGFTEYFTYVSMLEGGLLDTAAFNNRLNGIFREYYRDTANQYGNAEIESAYFNSDKHARIPYQRGLFFALYLDEAVRKYSNGTASLKDIMQQLFAEARSTGAAFSQERFFMLLKKYTGKDHAAAISRFITEGRFITIEDWSQVTNRIVLQEAELFDLGFTTDKGMVLNARLETVRPGSPAYDAGLRPGDILSGYSYQPASKTVATVKVKRGEETLRFQFLPLRKMMVPQLK